MFSFQEIQASELPPPVCLELVIGSAMEETVMAQREVVEHDLSKHRQQ